MDCCSKRLTRAHSECCSHWETSLTKSRVLPTDVCALPANGDTLVSERPAPLYFVNSESMIAPVIGSRVTLYEGPGDQLVPLPFNR